MFILEDVGGKELHTNHTPTNSRKKCTFTINKVRNIVHEIQRGLWVVIAVASRTRFNYTCTILMTYC